MTDSNALMATASLRIKDATEKMIVAMEVTKSVAQVSYNAKI